MKKVLLTILVLILLCAVISGFIFKDEIKMLYNITFVSTEKATEKLEETKNQLKTKLKDSYDIDNTLVEGFTEEELDKLSKGEITVDDVMDRLLSSVDKGNDDNKAKALVIEATANMQRIKANSFSKIGSLESEVKAYYRNLRKDKVSASSAKAQTISKYLPVLNSAVKNTDAEVNALLSDLKAELNKLNADTSIVNKLKTEYESEKTAMQSKYMSMLSK